ncbi:MAG: DUF4062 domain-containing protein [Euryarchaeota archaeon]|nr:DUF4062 domain-containing protein [Euryarchaeota archaeon]
MPPTVFISARIEELEEERKKVKEGISELWNDEDIPLKVWDWENAKEIPSGKSTYKVQSEGVRNSDIYVLILGSEYGDYKYGESPTHKEYKYACSEIEEDCILIYIKEVGDRGEKLDRWIKEIKEKQKHTYKPFKNPDELKNLVKNRLRDLWNKRRGSMEVIIKKALHGPKPYYRNSKSSCYGEYFGADKLKVEIRGDDNSKSFIAFLVNLIFHNDDRDTTIHNITLTAFTGDKKTTTIPDMIKLDDGMWEKFDIDELTCRINKNTSERLFFRFISRDFLVEPEVLIKLTLNHTSGDFEVVSSSKFTEEMDNEKWAKGSSGGSEVPTDPCPYPSPPIPSLGYIDGEIPKM